MRRIMQTMKWFREVSVLAEDEQRRSEHPEIDVEHLFLALVSIGGPVTDALARQGVTLGSAREAFERIHTHRLSRLGIRVSDNPVQRSIPESSARGGFVYRDGLRRILENAAKQREPDVALFTELLAEPTGHIREAFATCTSTSKRFSSPTPPPPSSRHSSDGRWSTGDLSLPRRRPSGRWYRMRIAGWIGMTSSSQAPRPPRRARSEHALAPPA